ncbi:MAG: hypothetical protein IAE94_06080 [Chthoniobacterales bacterium]|nr:hypothetical protein [Chthoniobacterales bacterium]
MNIQTTLNAGISNMATRAYSEVVQAGAMAGLGSRLSERALNIIPLDLSAKACRHMGSDFADNPGHYQISHILAGTCVKAMSIEEARNWFCRLAETKPDSKEEDTLGRELFAIAYFENGFPRKPTTPPTHVMKTSIRAGEGPALLQEFATQAGYERITWFTPYSAVRDSVEEIALHNPYELNEALIAAECMTRMTPAQRQDWFARVNPILSNPNREKRLRPFGHELLQFLRVE